MVILLRLLAKKWRFSQKTSRARALFSDDRVSIEDLAILQSVSEFMNRKTRETWKKIHHSKKRNDDHVLWRFMKP